MKRKIYLGVMCVILPLLLASSYDSGLAQQVVTLTYTPTPTATSTPLPGSTLINPIDGAEMVYVPAGEFLIGSSEDDPDADSDEKPQHTVYLDAFWIYKTEVTNAQYRKCVEAGACTLPYKTKYYDDPAYADHPVVSVDWNQAKAYSEWAGGRLPTEAEWEKTARGTDGRIWPWGDEWDANKVNSWEAGPHHITKVGSYPTGASPYGALDMAGNVWEWTGSLYKDYPYRTDDGREDAQAEGRRVLRGGSCRSTQKLVRGGDRYGYSPHDLGDVGFRVVVISPPPQL
ncbi:MAG: formylglycine-generating enzyme family protein [Anaerolineae bacterium]